MQGINHFIGIPLLIGLILLSIGFYLFVLFLPVAMLLSGIYNILKKYWNITIFNNILIFESLILVLGVLFGIFLYSRFGFKWHFLIDFALSFFG